MFQVYSERKKCGHTTVENVMTVWIVPEKGCPEILSRSLARSLSLSLSLSFSLSQYKAELFCFLSVSLSVIYTRWLFCKFFLFLSFYYCHFMLAWCSSRFKDVFFSYFQGRRSRGRVVLSLTVLVLHHAYKGSGFRTAQHCTTDLTGSMPVASLLVCKMFVRLLFEKGGSPKICMLFCPAPFNNRSF